MAYHVEALDLRFPELRLQDLYDANKPLILKGLVREWALVQAAAQSDRAAVDYLKQFYNGRPTKVYFGKPGIRGRYFYEDDCQTMNFDTRQAQADEVLESLLASAGDEEAQSCFFASTIVDAHFPGVRAENELGYPGADNPLAPFKPRVGFWIGNRSRIACHYDAPYNIACCLTGQRRFTMFAPEHIANLYPGPLDPTPGGQAVSMVDFDNPDFDRFPRFKDALPHAHIAELEPGDALYLPSMWWHQVEGLSPFNIMMNYWWSESPAFMGAGMNVLHHALLSLRDRPDAEKAAWRQIFEYYVFGPAEQAGAHLPESARGDLGPLDEMQARKLRAYLLNMLNR